MKYKKPALIVCGCLILILIAAGGFLLLNNHSKKMVDNQTSQIEPSNNQASASNTLSVVSNPQAGNLGQLSPSSSASNTEASSSQSQANGSSSPSSSMVNPSNFAQYNKYANSSTAAFADIQVGNGASLGVNQTAEIVYQGWLTNGTLFDQSQTNSRGQIVPLSFTLGSNQVITGLEEGVDGMKVGGTRLIIIPPALGYGTAGKGSIPSDSVLVFEVKLLDVN
jgi:FKBP-type peptidyl-prolyl cis-trans isomerase